MVRGDPLPFILGKQDSQGHWKLEHAINGKMWVDIEKQGQPSKWITLRALRVLKSSPQHGGFDGTNS
ncbi:MAG: hypothetical protein A2W36_02715 [Chloroflexi bacterium RBG_16_58_14]|nr:MAG: hypothetical protein A2W36_02715 [Chloroflexi bacterium RBG_16_58_14]